MGTRLYLVRHGETHWNAVKKFQGHSDISLSAKGRQQAASLANFMQKKGITIDAAYSSDLRRTLETAEILLQKSSATNIALKDLREINFGEWEGFTSKELYFHYPEKLAQWWQSPSTTRIPGGENLTDVMQRVTPCLAKILKAHVNENVLLTSHGGIIRVVISYVLGIDINQYWRLRLDNCSLSILFFPAGDIKQGILELYNLLP